MITTLQQRSRVVQPHFDRIRLLLVDVPDYFRMVRERLLVAASGM